MSDVRQLREMFPQLDAETIEEVAAAHFGHTGMAINALMEVATNHAVAAAGADGILTRSLVDPFTSGTSGASVLTTSVGGGGKKKALKQIPSFYSEHVNPEVCPPPLPPPPLLLFETLLPATAATAAAAAGDFPTFFSQFFINVSFLKNFFSKLPPLLIELFIRADGTPGSFPV